MYICLCKVHRYVHSCSLHTKQRSIPWYDEVVPWLIMLGRTLSHQVPLTEESGGSNKLTHEFDFLFMAHENSTTILSMNFDVFTCVMQTSQSSGLQPVDVRRVRPEKTFCMLRVACININGIYNKTAEISDWLLKSNIDVLSITETQIQTFLPLKDMIVFIPIDHLD